MPEDEHISDSGTPREIVYAATAIWKQLSEEGRQAGTVVAPATFAVAGISSSCNSRAAVTVCFPRLPPDRFFAWLGPRVILWPTGVISARRTSIVSSRIGKRKDLKHGWFDALRTAVIRQDHTECLCYINGTAPADAVIRASELFGAQRLRIDVASDGNSSAEELIQWLESKAKLQPSQSTLENVAYVSPRWSADTSGQRRDVDSNGPRPLKDTALVLVAERIVALSCRAGGHIEQLLERHLQDATREASVLLAAVTEAETSSISRSLVAHGAVPWLLGAEPTRTSTRATSPDGQRADSRESTNSCRADGPLQGPDEWLCHWTRPRCGPWIEQPEEEFLDELILGCQTADRSAYAALLRITERRQIMASAAARNASKTVSFTAVPLGEFRNRRIYRKHKLRFDFEPWGIAVRKSALEKSGCRPVTYVDRDRYDEVSAEDRCFQQLRFDAGNRIDWSQEREWRYAGDLDLSQFSAADVVAFVDTCDEATALRPAAP